MTALPIIEPRDAQRITAVAALTVNDQPGEALAALNALHKLLRKHGLRLGQVVERGLQPPVVLSQRRPEPVSPMREHQRDAAMCLAFPGLLSTWEQEFLASIRDRHRLSEKQCKVLNRIVTKIHRLTDGDF